MGLSHQRRRTASLLLSKESSEDACELCVAICLTSGVVMALDCLGCTI